MPQFMLRMCMKLCGRSSEMCRIPALHAGEIHWIKVGGSLPLWGQEKPHFGGLFPVAGQLVGGGGVSCCQQTVQATSGKIGSADPDGMMLGVAFCSGGKKLYGLNPNLLQRFCLQNRASPSNPECDDVTSEWCRHMALPCTRSGSKMHFFWKPKPAS